MREVAFIKQNKEKWLEFEQSLVAHRRLDPDDMANLYIHLLNDLSYSQTYYPKSKTTVYLNYLVSQIYRKIYKTKRLEQNRFTYFFRTEVPLIMHQYRRILWYSMLIFLFFCILGAISAKQDQTFIRLILGDGYVNNTLENIAKGDPVAVYKSGASFGSFIGITVNNIYVAVRAFIYGLTGGILTFYVSLQNGIMLGSFQYFFYKQGVLTESLRGIWLHGAMEIFSIVVSTAAGYILTGSILFPKTYSRLYSFKIGFQDGLKVLLSTVPFFIAAGFIEGFVTRHANTMPLSINLLIIFGSLSVISFYYLVYPYIVFKKKKSNP